jgi:hypothetical protein
MESGVPLQQDRIDQKLDEALIEELDAEHARVCAGQRRMFSLIAKVDRLDLWRGCGARDMATGSPCATGSPTGRPAGGSPRPTPWIPCP